VKMRRTLAHPAGRFGLSPFALTDVPEVSSFWQLPLSYNEFLQKGSSVLHPFGERLASVRFAVKITVELSKNWRLTLPVFDVPLHSVSEQDSL
jgi:hypothetical protein